MIKQSHNNRHSDPPSKLNPASNIPLFQFFQRAAQIIVSKSETAWIRTQSKMMDDPSVYVLPLQSRRKGKGNDQSPLKSNSSVSKTKVGDTSKEKPKLSEKDNKRLSQLFHKKHDLMTRLRRIDQELHNPNLLPVTMENSSNGSFMTGQPDPILHYQRQKQSRIIAKQNNAYNVVQHQRTMQMLTRINNEKMRRQEKIVSEMKKKQQSQIKKLEEIQRNQSQMHLSRQHRHIHLLKAINKKQTSRLRDTDSAQSTGNYRSFQKEIAPPNQFLESVEPEETIPVSSEQ